ncbi:MAG: ATP-binding protein [Chloroflexota bacterium]
MDDFTKPFEESTAYSLPAGAGVNDLAETLIAMANSRGGTLLLKLGNYTVEDAIDQVRKAALLADPTLILPLPTTIDQTALAVTVPRGLPHVFSLDGRYLARDGSVNRRLSPRELRRLLIERGELSYEEEVTSSATLDDLDWRAVEAYATRLIGIGHSAEAILAQRGCVVQRGKHWLPTNAGLLLFGKNPQRFLRSAFITATRFGGTEMGDTFTRQDVIGTLPDQIRQAETFLLDNLRRGVQLGTGMERAEQLEYPMEAARELVVNAVSHRDYSIPGDGIRLFLFSDRLEVTSPGGLPGPVTLDNIVEERYSRNSIIVQVLSDMGFIERLGYGVDRVIALMRDRRLPAPQFAETSGGFRVKLFNTSEVTWKVDNVLTNTYPYALNPRQEQALYHLTQGGYRRITNKDLQELFTGVHPETIRRDLADLVSKGLLVKMGQKRGSYYVLQLDR